MKNYLRISKTRENILQLIRNQSSNILFEFVSLNEKKFCRDIFHIINSKLNNLFDSYCEIEIK